MKRAVGVRRPLGEEAARRDEIGDGDECRTWGDRGAPVGWGAVVVGDGVMVVGLVISEKKDMATGDAVNGVGIGVATSVNVPVAAGRLSSDSNGGTAGLVRDVEV